MSSHRPALRGLSILTATAVAATALVVIGTVETAQPAYAAPAAIPCTDAGITVSAASTTTNAVVSRISNNGGTLTFTPGVTLTRPMNAIGYNVNDGLVYGIDTGTGATAGHILRFGAGYGSDLEDIGAPTYQGTAPKQSQPLNGVIDDENQLIWVSTDNTQITKLNVSTKVGTSQTLTPTVAGTLPTSQLDDVSFNPYDGHLYAPDDAGQMWDIDLDAAGGPTIGKVTMSAAPQLLSPTRRAGGSWSDALGNLYYYQNRDTPGTGTGHIWKFDPSARVLTDLGAIPQTGLGAFDATACLPATLGKSVSPSIATVGDQLTFTFQLSNPTAQSVSAINFLDTLPTGLTWVSGGVSPAQPGGGTPAISNGGRTLSIPSITVPRASAGKLTFTAKALVGATATNGSNTNTATVQYGSQTVTSDDPAVAGTTDPTPFTINLPPLAADDTATTPQGTPVTINVIGNDTARAGTLNASTITLIDPVSGATGSTVTVAGQGTYTVQSGQVVFTPLPTFTGTVSTPPSYTVQDSLGHTSNAAKITPTVTAAGAPSATPDTKSTPYNTATTVDPTANDNPGSTAASFTKSSVRLLQGSTPVTSLTVANEGSYSVDTTTGIVTFTPLASFRGTATAVNYTATTTFNRSVQSTITITVGEPPLPVANSDTGTTPQGVAITSNVLANDTAPAAFPLQSSSLTLLDGAGNAVATRTIAGEGTYDVVSGQIRFTPLPTFSGTATSVPYRVADSLGRTAQSTLTITVTPAPAPTATPDTKSTPWNTATSVSPLTNDNPGSTAASFVASSVVLLDGANPVKSLTVAGQGSYVVNADGTVGFTPVDTFSGVATAVPYRATTTFGKTAQSTITITVDAPPAPTAANDSDSTPQGVPVTTNVLTNDTDNPAARFDAGTLQLQTGPGTWASTLTVANQGTYDVVNGQIRFTPLPTFSGTASAVTYRVADSLGRYASATLVDTVVPAAAPTGNPDTRLTPYNTAVNLNPAANDDPGSTAATFVASTLRYVNAAGVESTTLVVANEGTWTIANGRAVFTPLSTFAGATTTPVTYREDTTFGQTAQSTITIQVGETGGPAASPDIDTTAQGVAVTTDVVGNDTDAADAELVPGSVLLRFPDGTTGTSRTIAGQGTYSVGGTVPAGSIRFTPLPTYTGTTSGVPYQVSDTKGRVATSRYTPTVTAAADPTAAPDTQGTPWNTPVTVTPTANDSASPGSTAAAFVVGSLVLVDGSGTEVTSLVVPGVGTYVVDTSDNTVDFTPVETYSGETAPVDYRVQTNFGKTVGSTITITVDAPPAPTADPDTDTTPQGVAVTTDVLANDSDNPAAVFDPDSLELQTGPDTWAASLNVTGQGLYEVVDGQIRFTPVPTFTGPAAPVTYRVTDGLGRFASTTLTDTVTPAAAPTGTADTATTPYDTTVTGIAVLGNDSTGAANATFDPTTLRLIDAANGDAPVTTLEVAGVGVYTVATDGTVSFDPDPAFRGAAPAVTYTAATNLGTTVSSTLTITVGAPPAPSAQPDTATTPENTPITVPVLDNDTATPAAPLDPATLVLIDADGQAVSTRTITGEGTYSVVNGAVRFAPVPEFAGVGTPVGYRVGDGLGRSTTSTVTVTVTAADAPIAQPDTASTPWNTSVDVRPTDNDATGAPTATWVASSVRLIDAGGQPATTVMVADQGTWTVANGVVTFSPRASFTGQADPIGYRATTTFGRTAASTITVTVGAPPAPSAADDQNTTPQGVGVTTDVLANDTDNPAARFDASTLRLLDGTTPVTALTVAGQGDYAVVAGGIRFTPVPGFSGTAAPVGYQAADTLGRTAAAQLTITVTPGAAPTGRADERTTPFDTAVTLDPTTNDSTGSAQSTFVDAGVRLLDGGGNSVTTLIVPNQGTWSVAGNQVTFTPLNTFVGQTSPVGYSAATTFGTAATSTITVTVLEPGQPAANDDVASAPVGSPVDFSPLANDATGDPDVTFVPSTLVLIDPATGDPVTTLTVAGEGTYTVDTAAGTVRFVPVSGFVGAGTPITYRVGTSIGGTAEATLTPTVLAPPAAQPDSASTDPGVAVTVDVLANDTATSSPLDPATLVLLDGDGNPVTRLEVPQGVFEVVAGEIAFTPAAGFTGSVTTPYRVADGNGVTTASTLTVSVTPPKAVDDRASARDGQPVTVDVLGNDQPGASPFVRSSLRLIDPVSGAAVQRVEVAGVGVYVANPDGTITFTPDPAFRGVASIGYQVADQAGTLSQAVLTIDGPGAPTAPGDPGTPGAPGTGGTGSGGLAGTGVDGGLPLLFALLLMVLGAGGLVLARRRARTPRLGGRGHGGSAS
ncbi:Ig-like domain-containing protein [Schumannella sp. 10F1B-5-1]|uniref:Ig-like domain-containing protein n=1 Tax=Schumannella sp. 10F1B-5-1 TaxID=2590780 RepID=UPI00113296D3|nr:Ig-like domain-containing protein [Schumannella sp. 10F1B-5-1]TPW73447.1 hypothetical protein FJ658_04435 [Schumannella sp. 10F1B-5-1]